MHAGKGSRWRKRRPSTRRSGALFLMALGRVPGDERHEPRFSALWSARSRRCLSFRPEVVTLEVLAVLHFSIRTVRVFDCFGAEKCRRYPLCRPGVEFLKCHFQGRLTSTLFFSSSGTVNSEVAL